METKQRTPQPFFFEGGETGLLLIHGFTGSTAELLPMGTYFHERGMTVHAPLLAGHGTTPEDMEQTTWKNWWCSAVEGYKKLREYGCSRVYVAGLSMGGLLALNIAHNYEVTGVVTMSTPVFIRDRRIYLVPMLKKFKSYNNRKEQKLPHIEKEVYSYDRTPLCCVESLLQLIRLVKNRIPKITTPIFIVQSGKDETVHPKSARYLFDHISSSHKKMKHYRESTHIITLDQEKEQVFQDVNQFFEGLQEAER